MLARLFTRAQSSHPTPVDTSNEPPPAYENHQSDIQLIPPSQANTWDRQEGWQ